MSEPLPSTIQKATLWKKWLSFFTSNSFNFTLIFCGVIIRLKHFVDNRPFWSDEAAMAIYLNIKSMRSLINNSFIVPDLPNDPIGFSIVEKLFVELLGNHEYAFSLFPLLCGIASLFLFYSLLKKHINSMVIPIVLGLFVFSEIHIYYSSEFRRYTCSILIAIFLYLLMHYVNSKPMTTLRSIGYALAGSISLAFSYSSAFILAGIGLIQITREIRNRDWAKLKHLMLAYYSWLLSLFLIYYVYSRYMFTASNSSVLNATSYLMPYPIWSLNTIKWLWQAIVKLIKNSMGLSPYWFGIYFLTIGAVSLWREDKEKLLPLIIPIILAFIASGFHKYLISARYLLIFVPGLLIIFGHGIIATMRSKNKTYLTINIVILILLFIHPIKQVTYHITHPYTKQEIRPLMKHLKTHQQKEDVLYLNNYAQFAYSYYFEYFDFNRQFNPIYKMSDYALKNEDGTYINTKPMYFSERNNKYLFPIYKRSTTGTHNLNTLHPFGNNKRTWILFSHYDEETKGSILKLLNRKGKELKRLEEIGSSLHLYDLSQ